MRFDVWESGKSFPIYLRFIQGDNNVTVIACSSKGESVSGGTLLSFNTTTGMIDLAQGINKDLGFTLDALGRIRVKGFSDKQK
jgi:hypothetical protein